MNNNKKIYSLVALLLVLSIAFMMVGCSSTKPTNQDKAVEKSVTPKEEPKKETTAVKPSQNSEIVIRVGHCDGELNIVDDPYFAYVQVFRSIVESSTNGRITVQSFPNSQLGDSKSMMEQVVNGTLEIFAGSNTGLLATYAPNAQVLEIPFAIQNTEIGRKVLDGAFGQEIAEEIRTKSGARIISWLPSGFRCFSNSKREIKSPEDMKGLKMRTMQVPIHLAMVKALGANPIPIAFEELYSALQTGVADGQENATTSFLMIKLQEVQKYFTIDNHLLNTAQVIINDKFFQSLSPEDQKILTRAANEAKLAFLGIIAANNTNDLKTISDAGVKIYTPTPEEFNVFKEKVTEPVKTELQKTVDKVWIDKYYSAIAEAEK